MDLAKNHYAYMTDPTRYHKVNALVVLSLSERHPYRDLMHSLARGFWALGRAYLGRGEGWVASLNPESVRKTDTGWVLEVPGGDSVEFYNSNMLVLEHDLDLDSYDGIHRTPDVTLFSDQVPKIMEFIGDRVSM